VCLSQITRTLVTVLSLQALRTLLPLEAHWPCAHTQNTHETWHSECQPHPKQLYTVSHVPWSCLKYETTVHTNTQHTV
jgi:hypothetical protein